MLRCRRCSCVRTRTRVGGRKRFIPGICRRCGGCVGRWGIRVFVWRADMKRKLAAIGTALVLALGTATVAAQPASACSLHVVYVLHFWGGPTRTTTFYSVFAAFNAQHMGVSEYYWAC